MENTSINKTAQPKEIIYGLNPYRLGTYSITVDANGGISLPNNNQLNKVSAW